MRTTRLRVFVAASCIALTTQLGIVSPAQAQFDCDQQLAHSREACRANWYAAVNPVCAAAAVVCACGLIPVVGASCILGCGAAVAVCASTILTQNYIYQLCTTQAWSDYQDCLRECV